MLALAPRLEIVPVKSQFAPRAPQGKPEAREWTRSDTLALSSPKCSHCLGLGLIGRKRASAGKPCACVLRKIFRLCLDRFRAERANPSQVALGAPLLSRGANSAARRSTSHGFPGEEYRADFVLIAKRTLTEEQYAAFRLHFLLGADYNVCCRQLRIGRGTFFHRVYRIEELAGRAFAETEPYPLWPTDRYFGAVSFKPKDGDLFFVEAA